MIKDNMYFLVAYKVDADGDGYEPDRIVGIFSDKLTAYEERRKYEKRTRKICNILGGKHLNVEQLLKRCPMA